MAKIEIGSTCRPWLDANVERPPIPEPPRTPQVGDVWRANDCPATRVTLVSRADAAHRHAPGWVARYSTDGGTGVLGDGYLPLSYTFDAEATAKAKAVPGTTPAGSPCGVKEASMEFTAKREIEAGEMVTARDVERPLRVGDHVRIKAGRLQFERESLFVGEPFGAIEDIRGGDLAQISGEHPVGARGYRLALVTSLEPAAAVGFYPDAAAFSEAIEKALSADSSRYVVSFDEATGYTVSVKHRDPSSSCARCGGPVLLQDCAREGGCRTAEERVDALGMRVVCVAPQHRRFYNRKTGLPEMVLMRESYWLAIGSTGDFSAEHPTREGAIALWRAAALAAELAK